MRVRVEKRHIEGGVSGDSQQCPVALAMNDAGVADPAVGLCSVEWSASGRRWTGRMDERSCDFVRSFDDGDALVHFNDGDPRDINEPFDCHIAVVRSREINHED